MQNIEGVIDEILNTLTLALSRGGEMELFQRFPIYDKDLRY